MPHFVFVLNPTAGKGQLVKNFEQNVHRVLRDAKTDYTVYHTTGVHDAWEFTKNFPDKDALCFISCGGDGTLHEVVNGVMQRQDDSVVGVAPCGSGNDFVKNFSDPAAFLDPARLLAGSPFPVDLLDCGGEYTINLCNIGFDAEVAKNMTRFKNLPLVRGNAAYSLAVLYCVVGKIAKPVTLFFDGDTPMHEELILSVAANGICYGGGYYPAPGARVNDGVLEFCAMRKMSRLDIAKYIGVYQKGNHLTHPFLKDRMIFKKCTAFQISAPSPLTVSMDGEISEKTELSVAVVPKAVPFWVPSGCQFINQN